MTAAAHPIALISDKDERQGLRIRRYMLAAGTSLMVIVLLDVAYLLGGRAWDDFVQGASLIVFMDLQMPELDGIDATKRIIAEHPPAGARASLR